MASPTPTQVLKSVGPKLVPFLKAVAIYFVMFIPADRPSLFAMAIKCLPIICLGIFVLLHGMSFADEHAFSRRILVGLVFSCLGDALLMWDFVLGMAAFSVAQVVYISAFGFEPLNKRLGAVIYSIGAFVVMQLMPGLEGILVVAVPAYCGLVVTMAWRAIARVQLFEELWTWTKLCSCAGGILFVCSDTLIAFNQFYSPIPYSQALIMSTYYAAQLGIVLSIVDSKATYHKVQEDLRETKRKSLAADSNSAEMVHLLTTVPKSIIN